MQIANSVLLQASSTLYIPLRAWRTCLDQLQQGLSKLHYRCFRQRKQKQVAEQALLKLERGRHRIQLETSKGCSVSLKEQGSIRSLDYCRQDCYRILDGLIFQENPLDQKKHNEVG